MSQCRNCYQWFRSRTNPFHNGFLESIFEGFLVCQLCANSAEHTFTQTHRDNIDEAETLRNQH